jgi:GT2 family glycosyltransferase
MTVSGSIGVLITCHNRLEATRGCLDALARQELPHHIVVHVYVVDAGSTDGTSEMIGSLFPSVRVIRGHNGLYWNGGMRLAFSEAQTAGHDYYLWLNDDTHLYSSAISHLLHTHASVMESGCSASIVVGSAQDPKSGAPTYGGVVKSSRWRPLKFSPVQPGNSPKECDTMNGNCVLVSRAAADLVGNLDGSFTHAIGDFDYGLRASRLGCKIWVAPGYVATCARNSALGTWHDPSLPIRRRLNLVRHPKGLPPGEWMVFARRNGGLIWPIYWLSPYIKILAWRH